MELHEWLMFLHVVAAMIWVGGAIVLNALISKADRDPDPGTVVRVSEQVEWVGPKLISPAAIVVIALGVWIVFVESDEWAFSQTWLILSIVLVAISMVLGMGYFGPESKRISAMVAERGASDPEARRRMRRLLLLARFDALLLLVIVWLMVFKPGA